MAGTPSPIARILITLGLALLSAAAPVAVEGGTPLRDAPVAWYEDDRNSIPEPAERDPELILTMIDDSFWLPLARLFHPGRVVRHTGSLLGGDHVPPAGNINALDEALNSSWFTNRLGLFPLPAERVAQGTGEGQGPDRSGPWTVVGAKTQGATPGFNIRDAAGTMYLIKFDGPGYLHLASGAAVISNRILFAAGYNVPDDTVTRFTRARLKVAQGVTFTDKHGKRRVMTEADLDAVLAGVEKLPTGEFLAISSRFLEGKPLGPFAYRSRRGDDPNDRIAHEHRRELRGLKIIAAWISHWDTKQQNSLDMYVTENGRSYVRHYLIDFASTLGSSATEPAQREGFEYTFDPAAVVGRGLSLGLLEDPWRRVGRPEGLDEVGFFESREFKPTRFEPMQPNTAFANCTDRDGYWAAKIISAFTDAHLKAIVARAKYENPEAAAYVAATLAARRDKIARHFFDRVVPLDFFQVDNGTLSFADLGAERGIYAGATSRYRMRVSYADARGRSQDVSPWMVVADTRLNLVDGPYRDYWQGVDQPPGSILAVECQVDRGRGWSSSAVAYIGMETRAVVGVRRP